MCITTIQIVIAGAFAVAAMALLIIYLKNHTLEQIRGDVYKMFLEV